jgi:hypothetical protein
VLTVNELLLVGGWKRRYARLLRNACVLDFYGECKGSERVESGRRRLLRRRVSLLM